MDFYLITPVSRVFSSLFEINRLASSIHDPFNEEESVVRSRLKSCLIF